MLRASGLLLLSAILLTSAACASAPSGPPSSTWPKEVARLTRGSKNLQVAVAFCDLGSGETFLVHENELFHAASTMKLPVMLALFAAVDRGELRLDQPVAVHNQFKSLVDHSPFALDPKADSDPTLYDVIGKPRPLEELIERMIVRSSNLATNLLIDLSGTSRVNDQVRLLGARDLTVLRGVEDQKAYDAGLNNLVTANDLMVLLRALVRGEAASRASSARMIEILQAQELNEKIPAGLPPGTVVAHKTGDITGIHHDAAIVYPPAASGKSPYVLVVLTSGFLDEKEANRRIAEISRVVWGRR